MNAFSPKVRDRYMNGGCALLALAIHDLTGWPIVQFTDGNETYPDAKHVLVQTPSGRYLDADGLHDGWDGEQQEFSRAAWKITRAQWNKPSVLNAARWLILENAS